MTKNLNPARPSWRDQIEIHPAALELPRLPDRELRAMGEDILTLGLQKNVEVFNEAGKPDTLLCGICRLDAMERIGIKFDLRHHKRGGWEIEVDYDSVRRLLGIDDDAEVPEIIRRGYGVDDVTDVDPWAYVHSSDFHRRHLTAAGKREQIAKELKRNPGKTARQIAETLKVSPTTVGTVRKKLEDAGDVSKLDTRTRSSNPDLGFICICRSETMPSSPSL